MTYNLLFETNLGGFNLMKLDKTKLPIIIDYYENGKEEFTISGIKYKGANLQVLKIVTIENDVNLEKFERFCVEENMIESNVFGLSNYLPLKALLLLGKDVTENFVGDNPYGHKKEIQTSKHDMAVFVNLKRIDELKKLSNVKFDFSKLVKLCKEINDNYSRRNFLAVGMLGRTILDHIPPVFGFLTFNELANNYGGPKDNRSFKKNMIHLNESLKNIADSFLHSPIRKSETLSNATQVDFRQDLDTLLSEIVRISK